MNEPTHALHVIDNWDGQRNRYWTLAYKDDKDVWRCYEQGKRIIETIGDEIIKEVSLTA